MAERGQTVAPPPPATADAADAEPRGGPLRLFGRGFLAMLPLWVGAIPTGIAYAVAARGVGIGPGETQVMSLVVFSGAAQLSAVSLLAAGAPLPVLAGSAMALNAQFLLLGLAVSQQLRLRWVERIVTAWFLTDAAYGVTAGRRPLRLPVLLGAGVSMYLGWNLGTALGVVAGQALPDPRRLGVDLVIPLTFLAVLAPVLRTRAALRAALVAAVATPLLSGLVPPGVAVLGAGALGSAAGAWWSRRAGERR
ncbi:MAG: AzlC family ABC transporter permease [Sphaerobacter sp.]|nr:AzlC family ABC transporter permease [Sphaerobacter sp.]